MKAVSRSESTLTFTGFLWVNFFVLLLFFSQYSTDAQNFSQAPIAPHKNVSSTAEYQQSSDLQNIYVLLNNCCLKFDSDSGLFNQATSKRPQTFSENKDAHILSHRHFKNSPITIRMVSLVLQV